MSNYDKKYYEEHKEKYNEYKRRWREKNKEEVNKKQREYMKEYLKNENNKNRVNEYKRKYEKNKRQKDKENAELVIKYKIVLDKIKEYTKNLLKEEFEVIDEDSIDYGKKFQKAYFSDSELEKILELLEEIE